MRTTIEIDDELMEKARQMVGAKTKKETVKRGLRALIDQKRRSKLIEMAGEGYGVSREEFLNSRRDE